MGQTTHQIAAHIENTRDDLGSNLQELEQRVKSVTDWKEQFRARPMTMLGLAFGSGVVLATAMGRRRAGHRGSFSESVYGHDRYPGRDHQLRKAMETWDNIKGALIGVAAARVKDFVGDVVPGFREELQQTEEKADATRRSRADARERIDNAAEPITAARSMTESSIRY
jgi:hypothetical protein